MSALDMVLYLLARDFGLEFASQVSQIFLQERMRDEKETQRSSRYLRLCMKSNVFGAAVEIMEGNLSSPCGLAEVAERIGASVRTRRKCL